MATFGKNKRKSEQSAKTSESISSSVDSIMGVFTNTINALDKENMRAQSAIEQTEQEIAVLEAEKSKLEDVRERISSITSRMRDFTL